MIKDQTHKRIQQVRVAKSVELFKQGLINRWGLKDYHDTNAPCYFFGFFNDEDIAAANKHKGFKLIHFVNARGNQFIGKLKSVPGMVVMGNPYLTKTEGYKVKHNVKFEIKDYSAFKPNVLGNMIYCYAPNKKYNVSIAKEVEKRTGYKILYGHRKGKKGWVSIEDLKANCYDKCFLNLNLSSTGGGGFTTVKELGLMGRMTIMNTKIERESIIPYKDIDEIIEIINRESNKIGTIQPAIDPHNTGEEWLNVDFWK